MIKEDKYLNENNGPETDSMDILDKLEVENLIRETKEYLDDEELSEKAIQAAGWDKSSAEKFGKTVGKSPTEHGFFAKCEAKMKGKKGWTDDQVKGFCASLIDTAKGSTKWREGSRKKEK